MFCGNVILSSVPLTQHCGLQRFFPLVRNVFSSKVTKIFCGRCCRITPWYIHLYTPEEFTYILWTLENTGRKKQFPKASEKVIVAQLDYMRGRYIRRKLSRLCEWGQKPFIFCEEGNNKRSNYCIYTFEVASLISYCIKQTSMDELVALSRYIQ